AMDHKESSAAIHVTKLDGLIDRLTEINRALKEAEKVQGDLMKVHPSYQKSARNLASYLTLRHRDIRQLQQELAELGLSSLGRAEAHVMASLNAVLAAAHAIAARPWQSAPPSPDFREGNSLLRKHTEALLGPAPADRAVRIMVTMPSEAASDYQLVHKLVARGMDCMRINCAYDGPDEWTAMADHLNHAREELRRPCRLSMDLAGPKLRVGPLEPGPEVIKVRPQRDVFGRTVVPARVLLVPAAEAVPSNRTGLPAIAIGSGPLSSLRPGNSLHFVDTRGSSRRMVVSGRVGDCVEAECNRTAYLNSGMELHSTIRGNAILRIGSLRALEQFILLHPGDQLVLSNKPSLGRCPELDDNGKMLSPA